MTINRATDGDLGLVADDPALDIRGLGGESPLKPTSGLSKTSIDMDFYDPLTDDFYTEGQGSTKEDELKEQEEKKAAKKQAVQDELDSRKGRLWTDPYEITNDDWGSGKKLEDLTDWTPEMASRTSVERIQVFSEGVPTLDQLANLSLPMPFPPHPAFGNPKPYNTYKKQRQYDTIYEAVSTYAKTQVERILNMVDREEKQQAVDDLFDQVYEAIKHNENLDVIMNMPQYPELVERALEHYLRSVVKNEKVSWDLIQKKGNADGNKETKESESSSFVVTQDKDALPVFMDLLKVEGSTLDKDGVPTLVRPLKPHARDGPGRMIEEWDLAAHQDTRRIMMRSCMRAIARNLTENLEKNLSSRIVVTGRRGTGKSTSLLAIVASARRSGHIVLYLPDGDRLRKHGHYNEANHQFEEIMFDLPVLAKEICSQLLEIHSKEMQGLVIKEACLSKYMSSDQVRKLNTIIQSDKKIGDIPVNEILKVGAESIALSSPCYNSAIDTLMNQNIVPFTMVLDDFNCYYDHGHYFNEEYDPNVRRPIPLHKMTLFRPLMDAIGVHKNDYGEFVTKEPKLIQRGGIIVGFTESHSVARQFTDGLIKTVSSHGVDVVEVPSYSPLEVDHILSNFEITGIGRLRFDRGETVMDNHEVAYLRMVSCGVGQKLLDVCIS